MPRIVKSIAVVEGQEGKTVRGADSAFPIAGVIKGGHLSGMLAPRPISTDVYAMAPKNVYLEELNRLKSDIEEARAGLRAIKAEHEAEEKAWEQAREDESKRKERERMREGNDPALANDDIYKARQQEIKSMVAEAERKIAEMTEAAETAAKEQAAQLMEESKSHGYLEGFQKGYDEATGEFKRENDPKANIIANLVDALTVWERQRLRDNEQELVQLVVAIAEKVVAREIKTNPDLIVDMLTEAVRKNHREEYIRINLAESLLPVDVKAGDEIIQKLKELGANITVKVSPGMSDGAIHIETPGGMIDMGIDTQLDNVRAALSDS